MGEVRNGHPSHSDTDSNPLSTAPGKSTEFPESPSTTHGVVVPASSTPGKCEHKATPSAHAAGVSPEPRASKDRPGSRTLGRRCLTVLGFSEACRQAAP